MCERAEELGGTFEVESRDPRGTSVRVVLPMVTGAFCLMTNETARPPLQMLIANDHPLFRDGTRGLMEYVDELTVVGEAANGQAAASLARTLRLTSC
jgi:hypothetical protein